MKTIKKILKVAVLGVIAGAVLTGCGVSNKSSAQPYKFTKEVVKIYSDHDTSAFTFSGYSIKMENLKYALAMAAQKTLNSGYTHFSIDSPRGFVDQLAEYNAKTVNEIINACDRPQREGGIGVNTIVDGFGYVNGCGTAVAPRYGDITWKGESIHFPVAFEILMHNGDAKRYLKYDAKVVLQSKIVKNLGGDWKSFVK